MNSNVVFDVFHSYTYCYYFNANLPSFLNRLGRDDTVSVIEYIRNVMGTDTLCKRWKSHNCSCSGNQLTLRAKHPQKDYHFSTCKADR